MVDWPRERTNANRAAVIDFLSRELGCAIKTHEVFSQGIYFSGDQEGIGRLQIGERLLAYTVRPENLLERLRREHVASHLRSGTSVSVMTGTTALQPRDTGGR